MDTIVDNRNRVLEVFNGLSDTQLECFINDSKETDVVLLPMWCDAKPWLPERICSPFDDIIGYGIDAVMLTQWVLWYDDGTCELIEPTPTEGWMLEEGSLHFIRTAGTAMPESVVRAARVTRGPYSSLIKSNRISWVLYEKSP